MDHLQDSPENQIIDLGAVSTETKGPIGPVDDEQAGRNLSGLSNE